MPASACEGRHRVPPRQQVLGLELVAAARGEAEPEVRQPLVPGAGHAELLGAVARRACRARGGAGRRPGWRRAATTGSRSSPRPRSSTRCLTQTWRMRSPRQSVNRLTLYAGGRDLVEVVVEGLGREVLVDLLAHLERGLQVAGSPVTTTPSAPSETTAPGNRSGSASRLSVTRSPSAVTSSTAATDGGEPAVAVAGAVGAGGARARRPRCAAARRGWAARSPPRAGGRQLAVPQPGGDPHGAGGAVDLHLRRQRRRARPAPRSVSAISLNECPLPSTRTFGLRATTRRSSSSEAGRCSSLAR